MYAHMQFVYVWHIEIVFNSSKKKFPCLGIRNCITLWYPDFLTRWENLHCENWKMNHISQILKPWRIHIILIKEVWIKRVIWKSPIAAWTTKSKTWLGTFCFKISLTSLIYIWVTEQLKSWGRIPQRKILMETYLDLKVPATSVIPSVIIFLNCYLAAHSQL